ncbi:uncharacterized protein Dwil_GK23024 [Drosophila willistoni]|uniref:Ionotropic glutamate receptor C-terminal domain-containing protein n=1 Tax=Drosophila willistoni TaxID=7260 RepID=B4NMU1_DROWI|nr:uncharacterized protein LOC6652343 [Drosophila willistoni]EDW85680.2 uncharacterized protein Dwil_GK23024 [Drosophila willistoni]
MFLVSGSLQKGRAQQDLVQSFVMSVCGLICALLLMCCQLAAGRLLATSNRTEMGEKLKQLLVEVSLEKPFNTALVYGKDCVFLPLLKNFDVALVIVTEGTTNFDWDFPSLTLILACGWDADREQNSRTLIKLQRARRLIYMENERIKPNEVCGTFFAKEQYNIAMIYPNFEETSLIYGCRNFQSPNYVELKLEEGRTAIFIQQFLNMQGSDLVTDADQLAPRSMLYRDPHTGETKMLGYVANTINHFVQKVNATLKFRSKSQVVGKTIYYGDIEKLIEEDLLDIGTSLGVVLGRSNLDILTYPYLLNSYCFMMPLPAKLPYNQIYMVIVDPLVLGIIFILFCSFSLLLIYGQATSWKGLTLSQVLLNDKSLRGLLGQSFPWPTSFSKKLKLICMLLCFASVMMTTMYEAYLQSFFTRPPPEPFLRTLEDVDSSRYLIVITKKEADRFSFHNNPSSNRARTKIVDNWSDFLQLRDTFNASYIYPVSEVRWRTYKEQQKLFEEPSFYYSDDICLSRMLFLCIPVRQYLPYRDLFQEHIQRQQEFGLTTFWIDRSFYDMVRLRLTPLEDFSRPQVAAEAIELIDLSWILELYVLALVLSCCFFALELCRGKKSSQKRITWNTILNWHNRN